MSEIPTLRTLLDALLILALLILPAKSFGETPFPKGREQKAIVLGHNVTPATDTLFQNEWTVGTYAIAYGLTDEIFLATSPWIWVSYNTANVHLKWTRKVDETSKAGVFVSYFDSYNSVPLLTESTGTSLCHGSGCGTPGSTIVTTTFGGIERYQWQSLNVHALYSHEFTSHATTHFNLMYGYFWNDDLAYSIRMDPGTDTIRGQLDLSSLTEYRFGQSRYYMGLELGSVGVNYEQPYLQLGLDFSYITQRWNIQIGTSYTVRFTEMFDRSGWTPGRYETRRHISKSENQPYYFRYLQTGMHPEIQIQYYF